MSAMMSPLFRVAEYGVEEYNFYPVRAHWNFTSKMEIENETEEKNNALLFAKGCNYGGIKSISFTKPGPFQLKLTYD
jgi:heat shock protein 4